MPVMWLNSQACRSKHLHGMLTLFFSAAAVNPVGYALHEVKHRQSGGATGRSFAPGCAERAVLASVVLKVMLLHNATGEEPMA